MKVSGEFLEQRQSYYSFIHSKICVELSLCSTPCWPLKRGTGMKLPIPRRVQEEADWSFDGAAPRGLHESD